MFSFCSLPPGPGDLGGLRVCTVPVASLRPSCSQGSPGNECSIQPPHPPQLREDRCPARSRLKWLISTRQGWADHVTGAGSSS